MGILQDARLRPRTFDSRDVSLTVVFSALMAVTTMFAVPLPFGGLTHFGNTIMWTASILFGGLVGGLAGGIGGMMVDLVLAPIWAPFTPFCKLASGLACGLVSGETKSINKKTVVRIALAVIAGALANLLAYAPVYLLLLGPKAALLWLGQFFLPGPALVTYVATPIIAISVMKAYPMALTYRASIRDRSSLKSRKSGAQA
jgi:uncharacterized membrane protein